MGLGYIGLPTAVMFANKGIDVIGVDTSLQVVNSINNCTPLIEEPELEERLSIAVSSGKLKVFSKPDKAEVFIITVPTPINIDKTADLSYVEKATQNILPYLEKGNLVVVESTIPPRTVVDLVCPILEKRGLKIGEELYVAHSPERVIPGKVFYEIQNNSRVIGGINEVSTIKTKELYEIFVEGELLLTDATTAEMIKLIENTYRDVNIAFANELAKLADNIGVDIWKAIEYANHHPRVNIHQPGPGVGGHCIAVDPWFLVQLAPNITKLIHNARLINDDMPLYTAMKIQKILNENNIPNGKVAILGLSFKANIDDYRESPSVEVIKALKELGLECDAYDPWIKTKVFDFQVQSLNEALKDSSIIVILTGHEQFVSIEPELAKKIMKDYIMLDTKHSIDLSKWEKAGFKTFLLGKSLAE